MPPDRYPPSYSDTPGACPQARHKPLSSPTAVPRVRSCPCRITLHLSAKSPFHGPEAIQRTTSTASRCKRDSAALRTADPPDRWLAAGRVLRGEKPPPRSEGR